MKNWLRFILLLFLWAFSCAAPAQVTIKVEKLSKPEELLPVSVYPQDTNTLSIQVNADSLVLQYGSHPFFYGMYEAYANHRPFVLSPDMIWMLVSQGFSHHINSDPEKYRDLMVDFSDKMSLVVESDQPLEEAQWDKLIPQFAEEIKKNTKGTIAETIIADFSTTTSYEQIASEITLMETTKAYFEFVTMYIACGIPEITLLGTTEDWQKVYDKTMKLRAYDLDWWIDELEPILAQFVEASQGKADVKFWRQMFKWHTQDRYGAPNIIDGWIVKFFPYNKDGKRFNLKTLTRDSYLPDEMAEADVRFIEIFADGSSKETMIELYGGFMGLEQNPENYALTPKIGWKVKKKLDEDSLYLDQMRENLRKYIDLRLNVKEVPEVLKMIDTFPELDLRFRNGVYFPDWMEHKQIRCLRVHGEITLEERDKILRWYPSTFISINNASYSREYGELDIYIDTNIGSALDGIEAIGTLYIRNVEYRTGKHLDIDISKDVTKRIGTISLSGKPSKKCLKSLQKQFPDTEIEWEDE